MDCHPESATFLALEQHTYAMVINVFLTLPWVPSLLAQGP